MSKKILVVWSGGLDSTSLLFDLRKTGYDVSAVHFWYGSKHNHQEDIAVTRIAAKFKIPLYRIDLKFISEHFKSSLLESGDAIPDGHYADENMKKTVVPFRNGILLSISAGLAESLGIKTIALGAHAGDHTIYPDCRADFMEAMNRAINLGTWEGVRIITPFLDVDKGHVALIGHAAGAPLYMTWTCYKGQKFHCGTCGACVERKEAFQTARILDPTIYKSTEGE